MLTPAQDRQQRPVSRHCVRLTHAVGAGAQYAGHIFGSRVQSVATILPLLAKRADLPDPATPLEVWEEIKSEPAVMCERLAPNASLGACQLEDGDILCVQVAVSEARFVPLLSKSERFCLTAPSLACVAVMLAQRAAGPNKSVYRQTV